MNNPDIITLSQKRILLKFIRTFYLMDYLDPINILKKTSLLTMKQYKSMVKKNIINNNKNNFNAHNNFVNNNINSNKINDNNLKNKPLVEQKDLFLNKLKYI